MPNAPGLTEHTWSQAARPYKDNVPTPTPQCRRHVPPAVGHGQANVFVFKHAMAVSCRRCEIGGATPLQRICESHQSACLHELPHFPRHASTRVCFYHVVADGEERPMKPCQWNGAASDLELPSCCRTMRWVGRRDDCACPKLTCAPTCAALRLVYPEGYTGGRCKGLPRPITGHLNLKPTVPVGSRLCRRGPLREDLRV